jgi:hypothetical protein
MPAIDERLASIARTIEVVLQAASAGWLPYDGLCADFRRHPLTEAPRT